MVSMKLVGINVSPGLEASLIWAVEVFTILLAAGTLRMWRPATVGIFLVLGAAGLPVVASGTQTGGFAADGYLRAALHVKASV